jgi:hypothetical protein
MKVYSTVVKLGFTQIGLLTKWGYLALFCLL